MTTREAGMAPLHWAPFYVSSGFTMRAIRLFVLSFALLAQPLAGCDRRGEAPGESKASNPELGERWQYPRERVTPEGKRVIVHAPQIRSWDRFEHFTAQVAVEFLDEADARYGVIDLSGVTTVDHEARLVKVPKPKVDRVSFSGGKGTPEQEQKIRAAVESDPLEIPLDVFLYYLADGVLETPPPAGFNDSPPTIYVVQSPAFLLFIDAQPVPSAIAGTGLETIVNANFPVFRDTKSGTFYLLTGEYRYSAAQAAGPWTAIADLPAALRKIPARGESASIAALVATAPKPGAAPEVLTTFKPAEIVVLDGEPRGRVIAGTGGLESIVNTESPLFHLDGRYFLLVSGRWFSTENLQKGPWKFTMPLPASFAQIPENDDAAEVRASIPGTLEARRAALEAQVPEKKTVKAGAAPALTVDYAGGEARFEPIPQTEVARAVNTGNDIIQYGDKYYLCYQGMWYVADKPTGPWAATADVPAAIYQIPPTSPSYPVTQVIVNTTASGNVESSYDAAYAGGMFVAFGVAYYGTGYYYPPYYYGGYYYPYYGSYGHGSWYNPNTGAFGSRSVYYGPYGGASYNQAYNPRTGRYGEVSTAWDGDEWASAGQTYNPRTGISTETDRHYSEDSNKMKMERTVEGPGGQKMEVERKTDFDTGTSTTTRKTSEGGKSEVTRERQAGGGYTTSGTIETAGGKTATIEGEHRRGEGSTTITGEGGQTVDATTRRDGAQSITKAEGSGGGSAISASGGVGERTTIAQSGSGDLYAGHDGEVYRKTDEGWQKHDDGGWNDVDVPDRPERPTEAQGGQEQQFGGTGSLENRDASAARDPFSQRSQPTAFQDRSQLNRDASARSGGYQNFQRRSGGMSRGARPRRR
jgi:hypothetical protein